MFQVTKHARRSREKAEKEYSPALLTNCPLVPPNQVDGTAPTGVTQYFVWPFQVEVLGAGDKVPTDYDPKARYRFKILDGYGEDDLIADIRTLAQKHGVARIARGTHRGLDLELRDDATPPVLGKMSDAKKIEFVMANLGTEVFALMTEKGSALTPADLIKLYNAKTASE